jgi:hypothetical protein
LFREPRYGGALCVQGRVEALTASRLGMSFPATAEIELLGRQHVSLIELGREGR